jgi:hypothetical protein
MATSLRDQTKNVRRPTVERVPLLRLKAVAPAQFVHPAVVMVLDGIADVFRMRAFCIQVFNACRMSCSRQSSPVRTTGSVRFDLAHLFEHERVEPAAFAR